MWKIKTNEFIYLCLIAYVIGLLSSGILSYSQSYLLWGITSILTIILVTIVWRWKLGRFNYIYGILPALIIIAGFYYYHWRLPTVGSLDISHYLAGNQFANEIVTVEGKLLTTPTLNQKQKGKFILQSQQLINEDGKSVKVTGKAYVTAPLLQVTGLYSSMKVRLRGNLYQPRNSLIPGGFDFADYLSRDGIFVGLSAKSVDILAEGGWWHRSLNWLRQGIVQTHVRYLKSPQGNLVSSMVIGRRAVDLDFELQDNFRLAGLAHTLATSGFHVSILLGLLLYITQSWDSSRRLLIISLILFIYAAITGFYPSIIRACLMGFAVVLGIVFDRSVKVSGSLLLAGVILLLINPLWIWDLGFQLSFLATWGLITSLTAIVKYLDWLPPTLANLVAVPLAATSWILPLQCYVFHYVPLYSVLTNIVTTPLVLIITLGGFISAFLGLFIPLLGSAIAYLLFPFIWLLIKIVDFSLNLPFSSLAVGNINIIQLLILYVIFLLICLSKSIRKYGIILIIVTLSSIIIPLIYQKFNLIQVTIFSNSDPATVIIQNENQNALLNLGSKDNIRFQILPFLRSQGINKIELMTTKKDNYQQKSLDYFQKLNIITVESKNSYIQENNNNFWFKIGETKWLIINRDMMLDYQSNLDVLLWNQKAIDVDIIKQLKPQTVIFNSAINEQVLKDLSSHQIQLLSTKNNIIQWNPETGFQEYNN